jgi:hypothetical protein
MGFGCWAQILAPGGDALTPSASDAPLFFVLQDSRPMGGENHVSISLFTLTLSLCYRRISTQSVGDTMIWG